jgi:hypothetical protein
LLFELAHQRLRIADERDKILTSGKSGLPSRGKRIKYLFHNTKLCEGGVWSGIKILWSRKCNEAS